MSGFYDQRANELLGAVNNYSQNLNSITQQNLQSKISNIGGLKSIQAVTTQTRAGGMEAALADKLQEHMNKFADDMGLDLSIPGIGKPVLSYASKKAKQYAADRAAKAKEARAQQETSDPENIRGTRPVEEPAPDSGTELSDFSRTRPAAGEDRGSVPEGRPTGAVDAEQREAEAEPRPVEGEGEGPDDGPLIDPNPPPVAEVRPPVAERSPAPTERTARPTQEEDLGPSQPMEVDPFKPGNQAPDAPARPSELDLDPDAISSLPDELGWKNGIATGEGDPLSGPGQFPASEPVNPAADAYNELNRVPQMGNRAQEPDFSPESNPFRFQGSEYDSSMLTKGPPAAMPEAPNMSFQYQAPTQSEAEAARGAARAEPDGGEALIKPTSIEQGRVLPDGANVGSQDARDQLANALKGGRPPPAQAAEDVAPPQPPAVNVPPEPAGPSVTGGRFTDSGDIAPPPPSRTIRGGPDYEEPQPQLGQPGPAESNPLERTSGEQADTSNIIHQDTDISDALAGESRQAASELGNQTASLTAETEDVGKSLAEKASSAIGEITGSDVLGGLGSFLGVAGDFLGPIMAGVGLFEGIKGIAKEQAAENTDPYASVEKLIAQGQQKMAGLDADISADQFAEKIGGTRAPAFGSLAAPVFSAQGLTGMSQHF